MIGVEYQLYMNQPPTLYVIRKVQRTSPKDVTPMCYYYILHGVVYQAPDLMSLVSSRLQMVSYYLEECLETGMFEKIDLLQLKRIYFNH
jgi:mediator of RNA polymerase II transcription subunit 6